MVYFKQVTLVSLLVATFCVADGKNLTASFAPLPSNMTNCEDEVYQDLPECVCSDPENKMLPICEEHFDPRLRGGRNSRIINGVNVPNNSYPWFVKMLRSDGRNHWGCGAMLVAPEYVLTAAHCVRRGFSKYLCQFKQ